MSFKDYLKELSEGTVDDLWEKMNSLKSTVLEKWFDDASNTADGVPIDVLLKNGFTIENLRRMEKVRPKRRESELTINKDDNTVTMFDIA